MKLENLNLAPKYHHLILRNFKLDSLSNNYLLIDMIKNLKTIQIYCLYKYSNQSK